MVAVKPNSPKERAWNTPGKVDRFTNPRRLWQSVKFRARKPKPRNRINYMLHPYTRDALMQVQTHPISLGYPPISLYPLVDPPSNWRSLPRTLEIPELPEVDPENVWAAHPPYKGIPPDHIRIIWPTLGIKALGMFHTLCVDPPKTALPATHNVIMKDLGLTTCSTHIFGVFEPAPTERWGTNPVERQRRQMPFKREVGLFPTNAVIWAAHCARLPRISPAAVPMKLVREPSETQAAATVCKLPVVPLRMPHPPKFYALQVYVYTRSPSMLLKQLFLFPRLDYAEHSPIAAAMNDRAAEPLVAALVKYYDMPTLLCLARDVMGTRDNMEVLGMVERPAWDAVLFAWDVVMQALERREAQDGIAAPVPVVVDTIVVDEELLDDVDKELLKLLNDETDAETETETAVDTETEPEPETAVDTETETEDEMATEIEVDSDEDTAYEAEVIIN